MTCAHHDYKSAEGYLSPPLGAAKVVAGLRKASVASRRANDILRAARLEPAALDDPGVVKELIKAIEGRALSPVPVVGGDGGADIADGDHRVSTVYRIDPFGEAPLKLA